MTKTFKFNTIDNNNINSSNSFCNSTDYSKILDDIIIADIIDKNEYLFTYNKKKNDDAIIDSLIFGTSPNSNLKANDDFIKATLFLANYKKNKKTYKIPYIIGKTYTLSDGTPIVFYDDEIQIGFDWFKYSDFLDTSFLNNLTNKAKKTIINIYTYGKSNIEINLL